MVDCAATTCTSPSVTSSYTPISLLIISEPASLLDSLQLENFVPVDIASLASAFSPPCDRVRCAGLGSLSSRPVVLLAMRRAEDCGRPNENNQVWLVLPLCLVVVVTLLLFVFFLFFSLSLEILLLASLFLLRPSSLSLPVCIGVLTSSAALV